MINPQTGLILGTLTLIALVLLNTIAVEDMQAQESAARMAYCDGVEIWRSDEQRFIPNGQKLGHPDHKVKYQEWCVSTEGEDQ